MKNLENYLDSFGRYIVQQSRSNLTKAKKNVDKDLYNSIKFKVEREGDSISVNFYMLDYGTYVDKGVSGNKITRSFKNYNDKAMKSPFKYTTKQPPAGVLAKWISKRRIKGRDTGYTKKDGTKVKGTGRFISNISLAYKFAYAIKRDGIQGISFFQRPLFLGLKKFGTEFLQAIQEDIITELKQSKIIVK
tara:strand:+ start:3720 stop:4289 length:570 start_codon:yes stop_codon:yes gene_type:complete